VVLVVAGVVVFAVVLGGPVAGLVAGGYGAVAARLVSRRAAELLRTSQRVESLDLLAAAAADLRAGLPASTALAGLAGPAGDPLRSRAGAAVVLAERTGAPLADVLERIEADARGADRARATAAAQTAGARATAWLLAGLPLGGIGVGYAIGADPLAVLLHTPIGAACAAGAVGLQLVGLAWTGRIIRAASGAAGWGVVRPGVVRPGVDRRGAVGPGVVRPGVVGPGVVGPGVDRRRADGRSVARRRCAAALGGIAAAFMLGGWLGVLAGAGVAAALDLGLRRLPQAAERSHRAAGSAELPLAADLLAVALRGGAPVDRAAAAVSDALPGPIGDRLAWVGRVLQLGGTPAEAWAQLAQVEGAARLVRAAVRSAEHGSALAGALGRLADDLRADRAVAIEAAARRAGVLIVLPLGLCFLPAFILAGLVPVIVAILGDVL
jgi:Flp pilus assembly protein TadB